MDIIQLKVNVKDLKEIVGSQVQVRTNKLKPYIEHIEEAVNHFDDMLSQVVNTPNTDPEKELDEFTLAVNSLINKFDIPKDKAIEMLEEGLEAGKENRYLKRKLTMFELKIGKYETQLREQKKQIKDFENGVQTTIFDD